jgi:hypothetical protein
MVCLKIKNIIKRKTHKLLAKQFPYQIENILERQKMEGGEEGAKL